MDLGDAKRRSVSKLYFNAASRFTSELTVRVTLK